MKTELKRVYVQRTGKLADRIRTTTAWLDRQPLDPRVEQAHTDEGSHEQLYWHFGYLVALRDVAKLFGVEAGARTKCCELLNDHPKHVWCPDCPRRTDAAKERQ